MIVNKPGYSTQVVMKPYFKHDCTLCIYLGSAEINTTKTDFYVCEQALGGTTLVYRHGDDGPDYGSTPAEDVTPLNLFSSIALSLYIKHLGANSANFTSCGSFFKDGKLVYKLNSSL